MTFDLLENYDLKRERHKNRGAHQRLAKEMVIEPGTR